MEWGQQCSGHASQLTWLQYKCLFVCVQNGLGQQIAGCTQTLVLCRTLYGETQELVHEWIAVAVYVADELLLVPETHAEGIWKRPRLHSGGKVWLSTDHELGDGPFSATQNT